MKTLTLFLTVTYSANKFWNFSKLDEVISPWYEDFEIKNKQADCNYKAGGSLVAFYCEDGYIAATSI